jgi:hypothetical protein
VDLEDSHTVIEGAPRSGTGAIELARGTVLAGRYDISRLLGRGGAGVVMQARDRVLGVDVAVKVLRPEHGAERRWVARLAREVKLARQIRHANVCRVFDFGQADGHAFLVMELAVAGSLRDELARGDITARGLDARLADARAVCDGLAAVHAAGILHRDVTPQNVLRMGDGRLVVSDFGLATDADPTESSIHGGTVAYMSPEIARGEPASEASDVWALGVILHEIVLGVRPSWREGRFGPMLAGGAGGALGAIERHIVRICRACTHERARQRPAAAEVTALVARATARATPAARRRRSRLVAAGLTVAVAAVAVATRHLPRARPAAAAPSLAINITGQAADWSASARVLTAVDGPIRALTPLPGRGRVRMSWGDRHTEDVDLETGARRPAAGPRDPDPAGPPVPSPDGASIAVEGYAAGGRPVIFLGGSSREGRLVPVTAAADPSMASQPRWLPDSRAFAYDADVRNVGVFSLDTNRTTILPAFDARPSFTTFKATVGDRVLVARIAEGATSQIALFAWPSMEIVSRFDLRAFAVEWHSLDGQRLYGVAHEPSMESELVALDVAAREAKRIGVVPGQTLTALALTGDALVLASERFSGELSIDDARGGHVVTHDLQAREVARDGARLLVSALHDGAVRIVELDGEGRTRGFLTDGPRDEAPSILPGGREWTYVRHVGERLGLYRCAFAGGCRRLTQAPLFYATVSPDGRRVAYVDPAPQGQRARLVALAGGEARDIGDASSFCRPVWSSSRTLWISRRAEGTPEWVEIDVDTPDARPTGRTMRGERHCSDGLPDPAAPTRDGVKIVADWRSELRVQPIRP